MLKEILLMIVLTASMMAHGQDIAELEQRNGFKDLKLGIPIDSVKGETKLRKSFLEQGQFDAHLYTVDHPDYQRIGEVSVRKVEIKTYKDHIYQIHVVTDKDSRLMRALESIYGPSTYDMKRETYFWKGDTLILKFRSFSRNQLEMIFTSYLILQQMNSDKAKKVDDIADDF